MAHKLVVIGGGAGGLELITRLGWARSLKKRNVELTLIDGRPSHVWKPLLHEVATGSLNTGHDELNYYAHGAQNNFSFLLGWASHVDRPNKTVRLNPLTVRQKIIAKAREVPYDTLVLACGAVPETFGTPGAKRHSLFLNNVDNADNLRVAILTQVFKVLYGESPEPKLRVGIVGAGATGVELATEIHRTIKSLYFTGFKLDQLEITVMDMADRVLATADPALSEFARKLLEKMNIEVKLKTKIKAVTEKGFELGDGTFLKKEIRVWTAGVRCSKWLGKVGVKTNKANRIIVTPHLYSVDDPNIFALGDCSCTPEDASQNPSKCLPQTAQLAHQQATWLRKYLTKRIINDGKNPGGRPFKFVNQGYIVSLGADTAVGAVAILGLKDHNIKGLLARAIYHSLYRKHQASVFGIPRMIALFIGDQFHYAVMPELKFH